MPSSAKPWECLTVIQNCAGDGRMLKVVLEHLALTYFSVSPVKTAST